MFKKAVSQLILIATLCFTASAYAAEEYVIDTKGMHASIQFRVKHLGFSWLTARFNKFDGRFTYDEANPGNNKVQVNVDVTSLDSNHAERDKHLRDERFFDTDKHPKASFTSTGYEDKGNGKGVLKGDFNLRGVTQSIAIDVQQIGAGDDPWGGYRRGFAGTVVLNLSDYKMAQGKMLGPAAEKVELNLYVEGVRQ